MSEPWKEIDLSPEPGETTGADTEGAELDAAAEQDWTERLGPLIGPALVAGSFVLVAPVGYSFALFAALVVAAILYLTRPSAKPDIVEEEWR